MRDYKIHSKRSPHSYQEIIGLLSALLSRDYSTLINKLQHSYQQITTLLSTNYSTPIKRSQHSCQQITALLSTDYNKHNENARIFKFLPPMCPIHINFLPALSYEKVLHPV